MNDDIKAMLAQGPGFYLLSNAGFLRTHKQYVRMEVDGDGIVHQLTPQDRRDGVLSPDGFAEHACIFIESPGGAVVRITLLGQVQWPLLPHRLE